MRDGRKRRSHRGGRFACRHHVKWAAGQHIRDLRIGERARDHTMRADRINAGADNRLKIVRELRNGNRQ
jgi:hypothetical protein